MRARTAFAQNDAYNRNGKARHSNQVVSDGIPLTALFCFHAAKCTLGVHQANDRTTEFFRLLHQAETLAVAFGLRAAKITSNTLLQVGTLFFSNHRNRHAVNPANATG